MTQNPSTSLRSRGASTTTILAIGMTLAACGGDDNLIVVRPSMVLEPDAGNALRFDQVILGRTKAAPVVVTVKNVGEGSLGIDDVRVEGEAAAQFRVSSFPRTVVPGAAREIFVRFEPTAPGDFEATLVIESNDRDRPRVTFPLSGPSREPCILEAGPPHQSFLLGEIRTVSLRSSTTSPCTVTRLFTDRTLFEILDEPETPFEIPAQTTLDLEVQHVDIARSPGVPVRELRVRDIEGTEQVVTFAGEPPVNDCFSAFPSRLVWPTTTQGQATSQRVTVTNHCSRAAAVTSAVISSGFYYFTTDRSIYPVMVEPLESLDVWVTYNPFSPLGDGGWLTINTNDAAHPRFRVELYGEAAVPQLQSFPAALDFGTVVFKNPSGTQHRSECASRSQIVQVYSVGDAPLIVDRLELDSTGDGVFLISSVTLDGQPVFDFTQPITVQPESEMRIALQFYPTRDDPDSHRSRLFIHHNAEGRVQEVVLLGRGADDGATRDVFEQLQGPKVDILWVIDDSCSMYDEQARLISNLSQFVTYADSQNADYQMAVTVTDSRSSNAGKFRRCFPHPAIIASDYADTAARENAFACLFDVGVTGGGLHEAGLGAAMRALERATNPNLDPSTNVNRGFLRPDAKLAVVAMSDEDDQSAESDPVLRDYFFSVKGAHRPDRVGVHAIAGPVFDVCQLGIRFAAPGFRYYNMTQETGGIFFDICEQDWQPVLRDLGLGVFTPVDEWDLSQAADPGSLVVQVDGVAVPRDPANGYTYNPIGNSVRFNGLAVPTPGAEIIVDYTGLCRP